MNKYDWIDFYTKFATQLLDYKDNREELIRKIINIYDRIEQNLPKLDENGIPYDMDPFSVFALFNKSLTKQHRQEIISEVIKEFNIDAKVPDNFRGIPLLNPQAATFYFFKNDPRYKDDQVEALWDLFSIALKYADDPVNNREEFIKKFDHSQDFGNVKWNVTMGLFWFRPDTFINLDGKNRDLIKKQDFIPKENKAFLNTFPNGKDYLELNDRFKDYFKSPEALFHSFPEFSDEAWESRETSSKNSNASFLKWFRPVLIALKDLGGSGTPAEVKDQIAKNENLTKKELNEKRGKNQVNRFSNEVDFARAYLVKAGYIDNSNRGIWTLTEEGKKVEMTDDLASSIFKDNNKKLRKENESNALGDEDVEIIRHWTFSPGEQAKKWEEFYNQGIMAIGYSQLGDLSSYESKDEIVKELQKVKNSDQKFSNSALAIWQFVNEVKPGDVIYAKKGRNEILGKGIVESIYEFNPESEDQEYTNIRKVKWINKGKWNIKDSLATKTLTDITDFPKIIDNINALIESEEENEETTEVETALQEIPSYSREDFLNEVYIDEEKYNELINLLRTDKNIILQGPPGVGKTFLAKRLAYFLMGEKDIDRVEMIQFHQSYAYEDFIMGYRPSENNFELREGIFYKFCKKAEDDSEHDYFFIIDEINRGNLSKIFGELFMLIEKDKRGKKNRIKLLYEDQYFSIPENVYIIGMMNTADRSIALLDFALRRRFGFFPLEPGFESDGFINYLNEIDNPKLYKLIQVIKELNKEIKEDETLGAGFCIGHSFFSNLDKQKIEDDKRLESIVNYELIPLLGEYWFDEPKKVDLWRTKLKNALN